MLTLVKSDLRKVFRALPAGPTRIVVAVLAVVILALEIHSTWMLVLIAVYLTRTYHVHKHHKAALGRPPSDAERKD